MSNEFSNCNCYCSRLSSDEILCFYCGGAFTAEADSNGYPKRNICPTCAGLQRSSGKIIFDLPDKLTFENKHYPTEAIALRGQIRFAAQVQGFSYNYVLPFLERMVYAVTDIAKKAANGADVSDDWDDFLEMVREYVKPPPSERPEFCEGCPFEDSTSCAGGVIFGFVTCYAYVRENPEHGQPLGDK